jgi:hypothetical protein
VLVFLIIITALATVVYRGYIFDIIDENLYKNELSINWGDVIQRALVIISAIASILTIIAYFRPCGLESPLSGNKAKKEEASSRVHLRHAMIDQVRNIWIKGILDNSLYEVAAIDLGLAEQRDKVNLHRSFEIKKPSYIPRDLP